MPYLKSDEARSLASVFGEIDIIVAVLLEIFSVPYTTYEAWKRLETTLPKEHQINRSTLYRKVNGLLRRGFLDVVRTKTFVRGKLRLTKRVFRLSLKGAIASSIETYLMHLDPRMPPSVRARCEENIRRFESMLGSSMVIAFLRWHKARNIDLSNARIDTFYFYMTALTAMRDHLDDIPDSSLRLIARELKRIGNQVEGRYQKRTKPLASRRKGRAESEFQEILAPSNYHLAP